MENSAFIKRYHLHLYNIQEDKTELVDLPFQHPEVAKKLVDEWETWTKTHQVLPESTKKYIRVDVRSC